eukprot:2769824-Lingulodinium_polyedra.AAC.1
MFGVFRRSSAFSGVVRRSSAFLSRFPRPQNERFREPRATPRQPAAWGGAHTASCRLGAYRAQYSVSR